MYNLKQLPTDWSSQ